MSLILSEHRRYVKASLIVAHSHNYLYPAKSAGEPSILTFNIHVVHFTDTSARDSVKNVPTRFFS